MARQKLVMALEAKRRAGYGLEAIKRLEAGRSIIYKVGDRIVEEQPDLELRASAFGPFFEATRSNDDTTR